VSQVFVSGRRGELPAAANVAEDEATIPPRPPEIADTRARPFLCQRDPVAFDLSALRPGPETPMGFAGAWDHARAVTTLPGLVVAYAGLSHGPELVVRVGAVRHDTPYIYTFMKTLPGAAPARIGLQSPDPFRITSDHQGQNFITAFGSTRDRDGFVVSGITIDAHLDRDCRALRNVYVRMTLPKQNATQHFGGVVLGEALGPMDFATDPHGVPDAWTVTLVGDYLNALSFSL